MRRRSDGGHDVGGRAERFNSRSCGMRDGAAETCSHSREVQDDS